MWRSTVCVPYRSRRAMRLAPESALSILRAVRIPLDRLELGSAAQVVSRGLGRARLRVLAN